MARLLDRARKRLSYANVMSTAAVFLALGGVAVAAGVPRKSVGPAQLKSGAVTTKALRNLAVSSRKLGNKSVVAGKLGRGAVLPGALTRGAVLNSKIANFAVTSSKLGTFAVTSGKLADGTVTTDKLAGGAVGTPQLANDAVTGAKLAPDIGPLVGTLRSGQTLRGVFNFGGSGTAPSEFRTAQSFQFPLLNPLLPANAVVLSLFGNPNLTTPQCQGLSGGNQQTPQAAPGYLCVYWTGKTGTAGIDADPTIESNALSRLGFGLVGSSDSVGNIQYTGLWAVTAP